MCSYTVECYVHRVYCFAGKGAVYIPYGRQAVGEPHNTNRNGVANAGFISLSPNIVGLVLRVRGHRVQVAFSIAKSIKIGDEYAVASVNGMRSLQHGNAGIAVAACGIGELAADICTVKGYL